MKISITSIQEDNFNVSESAFCGIDCFHITPKIDAKWNENNLFFRSLITDKEGAVLSCGWPKFFNYGEKPNCYPSAENFNDWKIEEKKDGSLVICDYVNEQFCMRTRGTVSYKTLPNAKDFELLSEKHPKLLDFLKENQHLSLLFEIVTPNNVIVIRPKEIEFYLLGAINKNGMVVVSSFDLTNICRKIGPVSTPKTYNFNDARDLSKISEYIKNWKGEEGVVVSYNKGQNRIKIKSDWYLFCHKVKSQLNSTNNLIDFYIDKKMPNEQDFYSIIESEFDYEIALQLKSEIEKICDAGEKAKDIIENIANMIKDIRNAETRKEQAEMIKKSCQGNASYAFSLLSNKEINKTQWFKLIQEKYEN
jgi:hypothetical protein